MELIHPDDLAAALHRGQQLRQGSDGLVDAELRYIHRSGNVVWVRVSVSMVRDAGGKPLYFAVCVEDITERRRAAEALRESEDRFRIMSDRCPTIMWVTNAEGGI